MRKKDDSLRELLLAAARDIVAEKGSEALNIRVLASRAGIATGTIYNYFENKDDILLSLADEYWKKALVELKQRLISGRFADQLDQICAFLRERIRDSHGNLMSSLGNVRVTARERMRSMQSLVVGELITRLEEDLAIRPHLWTSSFTKERFAQFVFENLLSSISSETCESAFLVEVVSRILYGE